MVKKLLTSDNCGFCRVLKEELKEDIARGEIEVVDVERNRDARDLARLFGGVPTLIEEKDGEIVELIMVEDPSKKKKINVRW